MCVTRMIAVHSEHDPKRNRSPAKAIAMAVRCRTRAKTYNAIERAKRGLYEVLMLQCEKTIGVNT